MQNVMFFSQSGSEILDLIELCDLKNPIIVTNQRPDNLRTINKRLASKYPIITLSNTPTISEYLDVLAGLNDTVITLHGWLRIIPQEICQLFSIYNGHPAFLIDYPELKGKDQQDVVFKNKKYKTIGSVVHKVEPEVDTGEILYGCHTDNNTKTLEDTYDVLKMCSLKTWVHFFRDLQNNATYITVPSISRLSR